MSSDFYEIGFIQKAHGIKGEVLIRLYENKSEMISSGAIVKVGDKALTVIKSHPHKDGFITKFKEVSDRNSSDLIKSEKVFINKDLYKKPEKNSDVLLASLIDFKFYNNSEYLGTVISFSETKAHPLLIIEITYQKKTLQLEVPWVEEFILKIDESAKTVCFEAPKELFDRDFLYGDKKS